MANSQSLYALDHAKSKHKSIPLPDSELYKGVLPADEKAFDARFKALVKKKGK